MLNTQETDLGLACLCLYSSYIAVVSGIGCKKSVRVLAFVMMSYIVVFIFCAVDSLM